MYGIWYQVRGTTHLILDTWHHIPGTRHLTPGSCYLVPGSSCLVPGICHQLPSTRYSPSYLVPGTRYHAPGAHTWGPRPGPSLRSVYEMYTAFEQQLKDSRAQIHKHSLNIHNISPCPYIHTNHIKAYTMCSCIYTYKETCVICNWESDDGQGQMKILLNLVMVVKHWRA